MKWEFFPTNSVRATHWVARDDKENTLFFVIDYRDVPWGPKDGWHVWKAGKSYGVIPFDTPEEELMALAIAMWRLG